MEVNQCNKQVYSQDNFFLPETELLPQKLIVLTGNKCVKLCNATNTKILIYCLQN